MNRSALRPSRSCARCGELSGSERYCLRCELLFADPGHWVCRVCTCDQVMQWTTADAHPVARALGCSCVGHEHASTE